MTVFKHIDFETPSWGEWGSTPQAMPNYRDLVMSLSPTAYWRLGEIVGNTAIDEVGQHHGSITGSVALGQTNPGMLDGDLAMRFTQGYIEIPDSGVGGDFDFDTGDSMTINVWIKPDTPLVSSHPFLYLVSKGRVSSAAATDQSWSMRIARIDNTGYALSLLYRNFSNTAWNRWTSTQRIPADGVYRMVTLRQTFGQPSSVSLWIDGQPMPGSWDLGNGTAAPIQTNEPVWIGSSRANDLPSAFSGEMDELAMWRVALTDAQVHQLYLAGGRR